MENVTVNSTRRSIVRVCVDGFEDYDFHGRVESPLLGSVPFRGVLDLISRLEGFYNDVKFPQSTFQLRSFTEPARRRGRKQGNRSSVSFSARRPVEEYTEEAGTLATFTVHVLFRQNATWQGNVSWLEQNCQCRFKSTLELLRLMESALSHTEGVDRPSTWQQDNTPE